jgi:hypothetical protein
VKGTVQRLRLDEGLSREATGGIGVATLEETVTDPGSGLVGVAAASANAVYHATGRRIRSLPITVSQLL